MQITDLKATAIDVPCKRISTSGRYLSAISSDFFSDVPTVLVEITTDEEITGFGEAPAVVGGRSAIGATVSKTLIDATKPLILKEDPFDVERIKEKLYARYGLIHFNQHLANYALNSVEMALWDIVGKACKKPLYKLWGGACKKKIPYYGEVARDKPKAMAKKAEELMRQGFKTLSTKVGIDPSLDIDSVKILRKTSVESGYKDINIRIDANQAWSPGTAIRMIKKLEKYDLEFVEQPVSMHNLKAMARVRRTVDVPICSHESSWTIEGVLNVIREEAADIIQLDPRFDGGLTGTKSAARIAEAAGLPVVMHSFVELGVATCAFMHVIASCPNFLFANQTLYNYLTDDIIKEGLRAFEEGYLWLPEKSGIGVELDQRKVKKYARLYEKDVKNREMNKRIKAPKTYLGHKSKSDEDRDWTYKRPAC
ncbi:MAG: mandelate racemase/muconate lactonizing enzyme family protein [Candidatus Bathyarchaeota archaeon]|nr:MAG: mandelate racemase/muconate lactonizing enzyme family protein [Candidatus Bathyarchaeota archaeon]